MTALVTGAAGGIGRAFVDALMDRGHRVIGQDIAPSDMVEAAMVGDLRDVAFLDSVAQSASASGDLRAVVVAHGISGAGRLNELDPRQARTIMEVNFESVVRLWDRIAAPLARSDGAFVVVVSQAGLVGEAGNGLYCASKFALTGWLRGLSQRSSVRLRALYPGGIRTPLLEGALHDMATARGITYEAFTAQRYGGSPAGRIAEPVELRSAITWAVDLGTPGLVELAITGGEVLW